MNFLFRLMITILNRFPHLKTKPHRARCSGILRISYDLTLFKNGLFHERKEISSAFHASIRFRLDKIRGSLSFFK